MRVSSSYATISSAVADLSSVVEDTFSNANMRNIIFELHTDGTMCLIGINQVVTVKQSFTPDVMQVSLDPTDTLNSNGKFYFQINSKELRDYLNAYKGVRQTVVDEVIFETGERGKIKCTIIESDKPSDSEFMYENEPKKYASYWHFDNIPIPNTLFLNINYQAPEGELTDLSTDAIIYFTSTLFPILENGNSAYSCATFTENSIIVSHPAFVTVVKSALQDDKIFKDIRLTYKAFEYLDRVARSNQYIGVARAERYIDIKTDVQEVFLTYDTKIPNYKVILETLNRDSVVTINRIYMKDVVKRLSLLNDNIEFHINASNNMITLKNSRFSQDININFQRSMEELGNIKFKLMPAVINKAIIGNDDACIYDNPYGRDIFLYFVKTPRGMAVFISDASGAWFSRAEVKTY